MNNYEKGKARARELAVECSLTFAERAWSYAELAEIGEKFTRLGRRYGLLREFHENGIC